MTKRRFSPTEIVALAVLALAIFLAGLGLAPFVWPKADGAREAAPGAPAAAAVEPEAKPVDPATDAAASLGKLADEWTRSTSSPRVTRAVRGLQKEASEGLRPVLASYLADGRADARTELRIATALAQQRINQARGAKPLVVDGQLRWTDAAQGPAGESGDAVIAFVNTYLGRYRGLQEGDAVRQLEARWGMTRREAFERVLRAVAWDIAGETL